MVDRLLAAIFFYMVAIILFLSSLDPVSFVITLLAPMLLTLMLKGGK